MICHTWIDERTGECGWQGDLMREGDDRYIDQTVNPPLRGKIADLVFLRIGKHEWGDLERFPAWRKQWIEDHPERWSRKPTQVPLVH